MCRARVFAILAGVGSAIACDVDSGSDFEVLGGTSSHPGDDDFAAVERFFDAGPPPTSGRLPPGPPAYPSVPSIACGLQDGGGDAGATDGGDAGSTGECPLPAPQCAGPTTLFEFTRASCLAGGCLFFTEPRPCPGGCFRQLDGGVGCNE